MIVFTPCIVGHSNAAGKAPSCEDSYGKSGPIVKQWGYDFSSTWLGDRPSFLYGRPETGPLTQDDRVAPDEARQALADELAEALRRIDIIGALAAAYRSGLAG